MTRHVGLTLDTHTDLWTGQRVIEQVCRHEALGFESQWLSDALGREPFALASTLLANTTSIKVGTAVANIYGRDAMTAAQMRRTLNEFSNGRFLMGLGVSNKWINDIRHAEWIEPVPKLRTYLEQLHGDPSVSAAGPDDAPIYVAAHAPGLQKVAVDMADGIMTWTMPPQHIRISRGRIGPDKEINAQMPCVFAEDAAVARATVRRYLTIWLAIPSYLAAWKSSGFSDSDFQDGGSDALIDAIAGWGTPEKIAAKVAEYHEEGATRVIVEPIRLLKEERVHPLTGPIYVEGDFDALDQLAPLVVGR